MPRTSAYHAAEASGSLTYRTTCATRLTLGMGMSGFLHVGGNGWEPGNVGDFAELAPLLAPTVAAIAAAKEVAVFGAREQQVRVGLVGADSPDGGVGLDGERRVGPGGAAIR